MNHPFRILSLLWHVRRPSRTQDMKAVADAFWLHKGYDALTFFGFILVHSQQEAERINSRMDSLKNHETIHLRQAQSCGDSWLRFYWKYMVFWCKARKARRQLRNAGYLLNPFEMEAYAYMHDLHYLNRQPDGCATEWKRYAQMSLDERLMLWKKKGNRGLLCQNP